ncbi:MAG: RT0821/Lpp0805 family surface protein [Gammaproteobacteria bacterium]
MDETGALRSQNAFEYNRTNQPATWQNPDSGNQYTVTPTRTYTQQSGQVCREYTTKAVINGQQQVVVGTACRQLDGSWHASS